LVKASRARADRFNDPKTAFDNIIHRSHITHATGAVASRFGTCFCLLPVNPAISA
jgi:hypothetical protein